MAWLNTIKSPKEAEITAIRVSDKGLILYTTSYECFLWQSDKVSRFLLDALNEWTKIGIGEELKVVPNSKLKRGFSVEKTGNKSPWSFLSEELKFTTEEEEIEYNPYLEEKHTPQNPIGEGEKKTRKPSPDKD